MKPCPFCAFEQARVLASRELAFAVQDAYPVAPGHCLVVPRRHVGSFFELRQEEQIAMLRLLDEVQVDLRLRLRPDAYTIGINDGAAAGQSIPHVHIHLIPRYRGDRENPRGGVRWVLPDKADYWSPR
jgi:diadenosine tetraphosphate (Ap4A) HIT family hydrolase